MADIAVITGASSGLGVKFLEAVVNRYPQMDEYWILARRKERLDKLAKKYENKKVVAIEIDLSHESSYDGLIQKRWKMKNQKIKDADQIMQVMKNQANLLIWGRKIF